MRQANTATVVLFFMGLAALLGGRGDNNREFMAGNGTASTFYVMLPNDTVTVYRLDSAWQIRDGLDESNVTTARFSLTQT